MDKLSLKKELDTSVDLDGDDKSPSNDGSSTDYYSLLKQESYDAMQNANAQAAVARDQALKYTQNSLRQNGYANQGVSESTQTGIYGTYQNALTSNMQAYRNAMTDIGQQEAQAKETEDNDMFESLTTLMSSASSTDQLNGVLQNYGLMDENGNFNEEALSQLDTNSQNQLKSLYAMYSENLYQDDTPVVDLNSITYYQHDGKQATRSDKFNNETATLQAAINTGNLKEGDYVSLWNYAGDVVYMYYGADKQLHYTTKEKYFAADKKYYISEKDAMKEYTK